MAEEKKTTAQGWFGKTINWFAKLPGRIAAAFKNMVAELKKATWPSKKKLISSCITVMLFMLIVGAIVSLLDLGSAAAVNGLYKMGHPVPEYVVEEEIPAEGDVEGTETGAPVENGETPVEGETVPTETENTETAPVDNTEGGAEVAE